MIYLLLVIYILAFGWWVRSTTFLNNIDLSRPFVFFIFISKIVVGLIYGVIHHTYFHGGDTFIYLQESNLIGSTFLSHPGYYIGSILGWDVPFPDATVFSYPSSAIFWKDLGTYMMVHLHAILYPLTFGYYELHIFFIAIIGLFASLNFYKVFGQILELPKLVLITCCFFLPSLTFWTAGLHKDAYVYFGLSLFLLGLLELQQPTNLKKTIFKLITATVIIGLARHYLLALLFPATVAYLITIQYKKQISTVYFSVYTSCFLLAIAVTKLFFDHNLFEILSNQQTAFLAEIGGSSIQNTTPFAPTISGILGHVPTAVINVSSRPFLWNCNDFLQACASLEILSFLLLIFFSLLMKKKALKSPNILIHFILAYALSNLFLVGLLVANIGTIARYRAIALGILTPLLTHIFDFYHLSFQKKQHHPLSNNSLITTQAPSSVLNKNRSVVSKKLIES